MKDSRFRTKNLSDITVSKKEEDYILNITLPNGEKIDIMVPHNYKEYDTSRLPFGLNLVYFGHYK